MSNSAGMMRVALSNMLVAAYAHDNWVYTIQTENFCVDRQPNASSVQLWHCHGLANQLWFLDAGSYQIQSAHMLAYMLG